MQKAKKLEAQVKELKGRVQVAENLVQIKTKEQEQLKTQLERKEALDAKHLIRDRQTFEQHFGSKPRPQEEKYVNFLKMYENQSEKMRKELIALQADNKELEEKVNVLEAENFAISNGQLQVTESTYFKKGDGRLNLKIKDLEESNYQLQENLTRNQQDFKDLLSELAAIK